MIKFDFSTSPRILFRSGAADEVAKIASKYGQKVLFITGPNVKVAGIVKLNLTNSGLQVIDFLRQGEPTDQTVAEGVGVARKEKVDVVVACGGGSAIDTGKAISAMITNPGDLKDYLEVVGNNRPVEYQAAPFLAIPTTAGTGSEVTRNAVIRLPEYGIKVSLRGQKIIPTVAIIDPALTLDLPSEITANTGMDALTQLIEPYISIKSNPFTDAICLEGIERANRSLLKAFYKGKDLEAREDLSFASLLSGIALANSGLGAVHGIAGVIGGMLSAPHGALCARLVPYVFEMNASILKNESSKSVIFEKMVRISRILIDSPSCRVDDAVKYLENLVEELKIKRLNTFGLTRKDFPAIIEHTLSSSSMKGNPVPLSKEEIKRILEKAL